MEKTYTINELKTKIHDRRNEIKKCPCCNNGVADRKIAIYETLIDCFYKVYLWCLEKDRHEFEMKEIKHLLGRNEYARFGDLIRFGGLLYKPQEDGKSRKALYGINLERAQRFFKGEIPIPMQITGETIDKVDAYIGGFPALHNLLKEHGLYDDKKELVQTTLFAV